MNNTQKINLFNNLTNNSKLNIDDSTFEFDFAMCHSCYCRC